MNTQTQALRYHSFSIALHWVLALALVAIFAVGLYVADLSFSPLRIKLINWHKWAGICILVLSVVRLLWRIKARPPALPRSIEDRMPSWQKQALHATHLGLYALFFAAPLLGWAYSSAAGFPIVLFGVVPLPDLLTVDKPLAETIKLLHKVSALALAGLVLLHVAAALKHHWIDRDGLLQRMLPTAR